MKTPPHPDPLPASGEREQALLALNPSYVSFPISAGVNNMNMLATTMVAARK